MPNILEVRGDKPPSLEEAQKFVGGMVEVVYGGVNGFEIQILVNEEGLLLDLPFNPFASIFADTLIAGPALVLVGDAKWK